MHQLSFTRNFKLIHQMRCGYQLQSLWKSTKRKNESLNPLPKVVIRLLKKKLEDSDDEHQVTIQRISLTGFPAQSIGSSNTDVLDLPCLLVLITGTSQSRQHGKSESDSYYLSDYVVNSFTGPLSISS
ncbi:hypothetical protein Tco_0547677 [Tanacetum coccineum]